MKKFILILLTVAVTTSSWGQGMPTFDLANLLQAIISYGVQADGLARQALQYENQILQYETMLRNLEQNPLGPVLPNFQLLVTNAARIQQQGISIANGMSDVSTNIQKAFKTPQPSFGMQFNLWTRASQDALQAAMLNAGIQRDNLQPNGTDATRLQALVAKNMASGGSLAALQTLGEFAAEQVQESQKLRDLISAQQISVNTMMMQQSSEHQTDAAIQAGFLATQPASIPQLDTSTKTYNKLNLYPSK